MSVQYLKKTLAPLEPLARLERFFPHRFRKIVRKTFLFLLIILFALATGIFGESSRGVSGVFFGILGLFLIVILLDAYAYSHIFSQKGDGKYFEVARTIFFGTKKDHVENFIRGDFGRRILFRSGVSNDAIHEFEKGRSLSIRTDSLVFPQKEDILESYIEGLFEGDKDFQNFLLAHSVTKETLLGAARWVVSLEISFIDMNRWWSEERLDKLEPIGRSWSYGTAYKLERYSTPLRFSREKKVELHPKEIGVLENILSKSSGANALIVGEEGSGKMEVVEGLARRMFHHTSPKGIENSLIRVLFLDSLVSAQETKNGFERLFIGLLDDVVKAGNIIFVIPDFEALIYHAESLGSDVSSILSPYLKSPELRIVAVSDKEHFHTSLESNREIMKYFETILIEGAAKEEVSSLLLEGVLELEALEGVLFTYPAIEEAISSAGRYFVSEPLYATSLDLLVEAVPHARSLSRNVIGREDVSSIVASRTGVATGDIKDTEREKLIRLESFLHERVVGQDEAIRTVSNALRRARSGITNPQRPMGSFLFVGPTGVGKTETAKALGEVFFGTSDLLRLDMSEYDTSDALNRLIGGYDSETPGVLSSLARERQYGVLLLDEFEKTNEKVLDLFLSILDEGVFSDAMGRKISLRNMIIIATSNAGSDSIFEALERGENLEEKRGEIIDEIVREGIFKPELINRFDGVILFHALSKNHLENVARILLKSLEWRLKDKGMTLVINNELISFLVEKGMDPKFGARPLRRAIQDIVEKIIADKIISQELTYGSKVEFTDKELRSA